LQKKPYCGRHCRKQRENAYVELASGRKLRDLVNDLCEKGDRGTGYAKQAGKRGQQKPWTREKAIGEYGKNGRWKKREAKTNVGRAQI